MAPNEVIPKLEPSDVQKDKLTPETPVIIINRGVEVLTCQFNAFHYDIPPGKAEVKYGAAQHFKRRLVLPGSRNPHDATRTRSWIGIIETTTGRPIDRPEDCEPFTNDELEELGQKIEGFNRDEVASPARRKDNMRTVRVNSSEGRAAASAGGRRPVVDGSEQATPEASAAAVRTLEPSDLPSAAERDAAVAPEPDEVAERRRKR